MTTLEIVELVVLGIVALVLIVFYSVKAIKNNWVGEINDCLCKAIKEAEASGKSGSEKLAYVMAQVQQCCENKGIPFAIIKSLIEKAIKRIIADYNVIVK